MITLNSPPQIKTTFNPHLLDHLKALLIDVQEKIIPNAKRRIRAKDVGRLGQFDKLCKEFFYIYEQRKKEEDEYHEKIKKAIKERSNLSDSAGTIFFKRSQDSK